MSAPDPAADPTSPQPDPLRRRGPGGLTVGLWVLMAFFFVLPTAFRIARQGLREKENDIKDWLPSDFPETAELAWFADHFVGESFVIATWPGCTEEDQRLRLLRRKLEAESVLGRRQGNFDADHRRAFELGREYDFLLPTAGLRDWGGRDEKWLTNPAGDWFYITPDGRLHQWLGGQTGPAGLIRAIQRATGNYVLEGKFLTAVGPPGTPGKANPFYNNPALLCGPLFGSVSTGPSIAGELSKPGGPLWPVDGTALDRRAAVAKARAVRRLTGSLFAPAMPPGTEWTLADFRGLTPAEDRQVWPDDFTEIDFQAILTRVAEDVTGDDFDGNFAAVKKRLATATTPTRDLVFEGVFEAVGLSPPPRLTCLLVTLTELGKDNLQYALGRGLMGGPQGRLLSLAEQSGIAVPPPPSAAPPPLDRLAAAPDFGGRPVLHVGGPPVDNVAIDEEGTVTLVRLIGYSLGVGIVLAYLCFRSVKVTLIVFVVGGSAAVLAMAIVGGTGGRVDAVLLSMPSLVYVLGLSGAIHVVNYYRDERTTRGESGAAYRALRHAVAPCTLAALTTAIGLASLGGSNLAPISNFGIYAAAGVLVTLVILFTYLPAALSVFEPAIGDPSVAEADRPHRFADWWAAVGRRVAKHHLAAASLCLAALVAASLGLPRIRTSVQLLKLFDEDAQILHDYAWLEANFGKLVPMELIVRMPQELRAEDTPGNPEALSILERAEAVATIRRVVDRTLGEAGAGVIGTATAMDTFLPPLPPPSNRYDVNRSTFEKQIAAGREELTDSDYVRIEKYGPEAGSEMWRVSLRVAALSDVDYGLFIGDLQKSVEPVLAAYRTRALIRQKLREVGGGKISAKARVMLFGSATPPDLDDATFYAGGHIDGAAIYRATLDRLLAGERIRRPIWIRPDAPAGELGPKHPAWQKLADAVDVVVQLPAPPTTDPRRLASVADPGTDVFDPNKVIEPQQIAAQSPTKRFVDVTYRKPTARGEVIESRRVPQFTADLAVPEVVYTGIVPVVYKAQRTLLRSLVNSIFMAFVLIAGVMIVLLNPGRGLVGRLQPRAIADGLGAGIVSMIPNLFPVLLIFGLMGHLNIAVDIGTMMTASVAMGVAVDDTIHFLTWFRQFLDEGRSRVEAVIETYRRVGPAMTQTTIVGGLGLFVFALSTFTPTQRFGTLMLVMLGTALIGDLILLPALLVGPLGRVFKPRRGVSVPVNDVVLPATQDRNAIIDGPHPPHRRGQISTPRPEAARSS